MSLLDRINADIKEAMKAQAELKLSTLRMLKSDIQYEMTKTGVKEMPEQEVVNVIKRAIKRRQEAAIQFRQGDRIPMAEKEEEELKILEAYMPAGVSKEQIEVAIDEVVAELKPTGPGDVGKLMGKVMARFKGQVIDGQLVKTLIQQRLPN